MVQIDENQNSASWHIWIRWQFIKINVSRRKNAMHDSATIGRWMEDFRRGDQAAAGKLMETFYPDLRRLAANRLRMEDPNHTLQPTALVNELYFELVKIRALAATGASAAEERRAFFGIAGYLMRQLLIRHARPLSKQSTKVSLDSDEFPSLPDPVNMDAVQEVESVLARLAQINPQLRSVVELRVFEGLTGEQIAGRLRCDRRSVTRYWTFASEWLRQEMLPSPR